MLQLRTLCPCSHKQPELNSVGDQPNKPQKKTKDTLNEGEDLMGENRLVSVGVESEEDQCGMKMAKLYYI